MHIQIEGMKVRSNTRPSSTSTSTI
uniref:Predicted protein n=1 Tax=Hordeum vulgare subsp. vulgare TaxID=112509 RepID=F2ELT7_HORVV|nr:predicted protein [Hordeum vulgare subsp. vulgare]